MTDIQTQPADSKQHQMVLERMLTSSSFIRREDACYFYPFGNSSPEDLLLYVNIFEPTVSPIDLLLLGCGDLRNLLYTVSEAASKLSSDPAHARSPRKLSFHLNDRQPEVIARNIAILHAIVTAPTVTPALVRNIAQFWYSLALDKDVAEFWRSQMAACLQRSGDEWLAHATPEFPIRIDGNATVDQVKHVWRSWIKCDWTLAQVTKAREAFILNSPAQFKSMNECASRIAETFVSHTVVNPLGDDERKDSLIVEAKRLVRHGRLFNVGSTQDLACNPSMLLTRSDGTCFFAVHYGTLPMEGHLFNFSAGTSIEEGMRCNLTQWIERLHSLDVVVGKGSAGKRSAACKTKATTTKQQPIAIHELVFNAQHCLAYMESCTSSLATRFDVIDTSNLPDHCGLLNLLVHSSVLLKPTDPLHASSHTPHVLTTTFLLGHSCNTRAQYLSEMVGMDAAQIPTLLGLQLLEHTDGATSWGSMVQPWAWSVFHTSAPEDRGHHRFTWLACPISTVPVSLQESPRLVDTLVHLAETFCTSIAMKPARPGGPFSNGALLAKHLTYALATGRVAWTKPGANRSAFPIPCPSSFWQRLADSPLLKGCVAEILVHAQLNGLQVKSRDMDEYVMYTTATFPLDFDDSPTPSLVAWVQYGPVMFHFESLAVDVDDANKTVTIAVYLPGFICDADLADVTLTLQRVDLAFKTHEPMGGKSWTLAQLGAKPMHVRNSPWWPMTKQIVKQAPHPAGISSIVDRGMQASVYLDLNHYGVDAKLALATADEVNASRGAALVTINGALQRFWLPSPVFVKNVKISRKEKYVELIVAKQLHAFAPKLGRWGLPFHQSVHGAFKIASPKAYPQSHWSLMLGSMFTHDELKVKGGNGPRTLSSPAATLVFELKDSVQIMFVRAFEGHRFVMVSDPNRGGFGIVFFNQVLRYPPTRSSKAWTLALDIVYTVVRPIADEAQRKAYMRKYMAAMEELIGEHMINTPVINVAQDEVVPLCDLLDFTSMCCGDKRLPSPLPGRVPNVSDEARAYLRRGILTPLYPADGLERRGIRDGAGEKGGKAHTAKRLADVHREASAKVREMMVSGKDMWAIAKELGIDLSKLQLT